MSDLLRVCWGRDLVGELRLNEKRDFIFQYAQNWLNKQKALPLSIRLPLQEKAFPDVACRSFFANLLPEGEIRTSIARKFGISATNDFMLLRAIGGECAGAITLLPEGHEVSTDGDYIPITSDELDKMIEQMAQTPLLVSTAEQRLSLAGAQQKLPVYFNHGEIYLPKGAAPSSHILKPGIPAYKNIVENETFCMQLAGYFGLPVPDVTVRKNAHVVYIVERYDRKKDAQGKLTRIHQEDFCQALGYSHSQKYESEGGPNLKMCFSLLSDHDTQPLVDKLLFLQWVVFNYLIGNYDAHAKNIPMLITREYRLAPFYDLISTKIYPNLSQKMAMKIGGENRPDWVFKRHWERLADDAGVHFKAVLNVCGEMLEKLPKLSGQVAHELLSQFDPDVLKAIQEHISSSAQRMQKTLKEGI